MIVCTCVLRVLECGCMTVTLPLRQERQFSALEGLDIFFLLKNCRPSRLCKLVVSDLYINTFFPKCLIEVQKY